MFIEQLATFLENEVKNRLEAGLDRDDQNIRHEDIIPCFTEADNVILCASPTLLCISDDFWACFWLD